MPDRDDDRERTTPYGTPEPSDTTSEWTIPESTLRALRQRYDLLGELGRGGMGIVYRARDRETGDTVALKVLKPEIAARPDWIERFKAELLLARKITHKNVCRVYELNRFGAVSAISMEYVEGESLRAILERFGGVPLRRGLEWAGQICGGLAEAHAQGVIHRDLKPENILIDRKGQAKIMDFGIARSLESDATRTGTLIGTPAYMSPEQVEGKPPDARSDIYALGHILYEMFTGRRAFQAETPVALALKQIHETPPPPSAVEPHLPAFLDGAIQRCLEKNPKKRFQSVAELEAALREQPEAKPLLGAGVEVPLPVHLMRWQRSDWALLGLGLIGAGLFFLLFDRVFPYAALQPRVSKAQAIGTAQALVEKYAPETRGDSYSASFDSASHLERFPMRVVAHGLEETQQRLSLEARSWTVSGFPPRSQAARSWVNFDPEGRVTNLHIPAPDRPPVDVPPTLPEVLPLATLYAEELFSVRLTGVAPQRYTYDNSRKAWVSPRGMTFLDPQRTGFVPVEWVLPGDLPNTKRIIRLTVFRGRLSSASHFTEQEGLSWAGPFRHERSWGFAAALGGTGLLLLCLLCLLIFFVRRLYSQSSRLAWGSSLVVTLAVMGLLGRDLMRQSELGWLALLLAFVVALLMYYAVLSVPYYYLSKRLPAQVKSLSGLFSQPFQAQAAGLAVVRGALLGSCYLVFHTGLLWILGTTRLAATGTTWTLFAPRAESVSPLQGVSASFLSAVGAACLLTALPMALFHRPARRAWLLLVPGTLLWLVTASSPPGAAAYPLVPLYLFAALQGLAFSIVFLRYDLLTCTFAVLTVETWLLVYPLFQVFGKVEPWSYGPAFLPWLALLLFGVLIWLRPQLVAGVRRVAAVFE